MKISKDMYEYLADFADDKTIVNMLSVNKKFNDPIFFERIFKRKYPLLIPFKKDSENWKQFYLKMVKYINLLKEEYDIPYIPSKRFNPYTFYKNDNRDKIFGAFTFAVESGKKDIIDHLINNSRIKDSKQFYLNTVLVLAIYNANLEMIRYIIEKGANNLNMGLMHAVQKGLNLVKFMIDQGATEYNGALREAHFLGLEEIENYLVSIGAVYE